MLTIREHLGALKGKKFVFMGDCRYNMANSLIAGCLKMGMSVSCACPKGYEPDAQVLARMQKTYRGIYHGCH